MKNSFPLLLTTVGIAFVIGCDAQSRDCQNPFVHYNLGIELCLEED